MNMLVYDINESEGLDFILLEEDLQESQTCLRLDVFLAFQLRLMTQEWRQLSQHILKLCLRV